MIELVHTLFLITPDALEVRLKQGWTLLAFTYNSDIQQYIYYFHQP